MELAPHHHRTLAFCTPVVDTGGGLDTPLGLSCHTHPLYTAGGGAPDTTAAALADTLPVSWTGGGGSGDVVYVVYCLYCLYCLGPAGVEHGHDLSYKSPVTIHQVARPIQPRYCTTINHHHFLPGPLSRKLSARSSLLCEQDGGQARAGHRDEEIQGHQQPGQDVNTLR